MPSRLARGRRVGHRLEEGLVGGRLALLGVVVLGREPAVGRAAGVVVLDLVVVPEHHGREARLHLAQRLVGAIERVLLAVVVQRLGGARVVDAGLPRLLLGAADLVVAHPRPVLDRVVGLVVDVVAQAHDEVEVLARHRLVRVVVAVGVVLAGPEGEAHGLQRVGRQRGAEAPDGAVLGRRGEAVVVLLVGLQAGDPRLDVVVDGRGGRQPLVGDDVAEVLVGRHLEVEADLALGVGQPRPQRDRARRRLARHDALGEAPAACQRGRAGGAQSGGQCARGEDRGRGCGAGAHDELAASLHLHDLLSVLGTARA